MRIILSFIVTFLLNIWCLILCNRSRKLEADCSPNDYRYEFTDCDADGGRWRVAVPQSPGCENVPIIPPRRLSECFKSCEAGQFLNLTSLECQDCEAGTYSLGGGILFDEWDPLPSGFKIQVEKFRTMFSSIGRQYSSVNCSKWGWRTRKDMIVSQGGPCVAILVYTAQLVKPGRLRFTYQYADDSVLFQFQANSDQCESLREAEGSAWPQTTGDGVWRTEEIPLHTGLNIFQWKTMGVEASHRPKPVLIKRIEIDGVGYTSSCNPCPAGTYNDQEASKLCLPCPSNTYSPHHSTRCIACDTSTYYSDAASDKCLERPPCSEVDYYQINEPCRDNQTHVVYKWVEPKICLENMPGAVRLPLPGDYTKCPPCNPGTEYRDGRCKICKNSDFSDGVTPCAKCPKNTLPSRGHELTQWYSWPESLHVACISPEDTGCTNSPAWDLHGNYTQTGRGHEKWVYLVMTLSIGGFRGIGRVVNGELHEVGRVTFTFEIKCFRDCELLFMQGTSSKNQTVIQRWIGTHAYEEYSQPIYKNETYDFSWAFQKLAWDSMSEEYPSGSGYTSIERDEGNYVRIYQINVQNSIDGGASSCIPCRDTISTQGNIDLCIACDPNLSKSNDANDAIKSQVPNNSSESEASIPSDCLPCPRGQVRVDPFSSDSTSCRPCGPGLITQNGFDCTTDCIVKRGDYTYDLKPLKGFYTVRGSSLFTASGTQYFHVFNVSFCMDNRYAVCEKNVSLQHGVDTTSRVEALICQSTIFPPTMTPSSAASPNEGDSTNSNNGVLEGGYSEMMYRPLSTHAASLGDHLVGISPSQSILGIPITDDILNQSMNPQQFHFFYSTLERTIACPKGRSTTITFRCKAPQSTWNFILENNTSSEGHGEIKTLDKCSDGTCDGCNFHFIWETSFACHLCSENELTIVRGECKNGQQDVHYLPTPNSQCLPRVNSSWPTVRKCKNHLPFFAEIAIQIAVGLAVILFVVLVCFWRRHRRLEYKYMKLVASGSSRGNHASNSKDPELSERDMMPVAESCAIDDDDEDEDIYDREQPSVSGQLREVSFHSDGAIKNLVSKISFLDKLKSLSRRGEEGNSLEIMNLTDKEACS